MVISKNDTVTLTSGGQMDQISYRLLESQQDDGVQHYIGVIYLNEDEFLVSVTRNDLDMMITVGREIVPIKEDPDMGFRPLELDGLPEKLHEVFVRISGGVESFEFEVSDCGQFCVFLSGVCDV